MVALANLLAAVVIEWVGSAIIKAWNGVGEKPTCDLQDATRSEKSYPKCIQSAVENALSNIFRSSEIGGMRMIILPELGTGTAGVEKGYFYNAVTNALEKCLIFSKGCGKTIPEKVVFSVWSGDSQQNAWRDTRSAAARNLASLAASWKEAYATARLDADTANIKATRYLGVLLLLFFYVCLPLYSRFLPRFAVEALPPESTSSLSMVVLGWGLVAVGTIEVLSGLLSGIDLPAAGFASNLALGIVAAAICGLFHKATKAFGG